ncbi:MAG: class 1 isoprenoid biosynthesis enzyme [Bacillota bacterium]|nr:class 1 isoprenoid biosynthesis enzyme [Bacillota bacterium]
MSNEVEKKSYEKGNSVTKYLEENVSSRIYNKYKILNEKVGIDTLGKCNKEYLEYSLLDRNFPRPLLTVLGINYLVDNVEDMIVDDEALLISVISQKLRDSYAIIDDVIDGDEIKFNHDTLPVAFSKILERNELGNSLAILYGLKCFNSLFMLKNGRYITENNRKRIIELITKVTNSTIESEMLAIHLQTVNIFNLKTECILEMYRNNAAEYCFVFPYVLGLLSKNANKETIDETGELLKGIGVLSQIMDDILGLFPLHVEDDKNTISDLLSLKRTYVLVDFYDYIKKTEIKKMLEKNNCTIDEAKSIRFEMLKSGYLSYLAQEIKTKAIKLQDKVKMLSIGNVSKKYLIELLENRIINNCESVINIYVEK